MTACDIIRSFNIYFSQEESYIFNPLCLIYLNKIKYKKAILIINKEKIDNIGNWHILTKMDRRETYINQVWYFHKVTHNSEVYIISCH